MMFDVTEVQYQLSHVVHFAQCASFDLHLRPFDEMRQNEVKMRQNEHNAEPF